MADSRRDRAIAAIMDRDFSSHQTNPGIAEDLVDRVLEAIQSDPQPPVERPLAKQLREKAAKCRDASTSTVDHGAARQLLGEANAFDLAADDLEAAGQPPVEQGVVEDAAREFERRANWMAEHGGEGSPDRQEGVAIGYRHAAFHLREELLGEDPDEVRASPLAASHSDGAEGGGSGAGDGPCQGGDAHTTGAASTSVDEAASEGSGAASEELLGGEPIYVAHWDREPTPEERKALAEIVTAAVEKLQQCDYCNGERGYWVTAGKMGDSVGRRRWVKCERCGGSGEKAPGTATSSVPEEQPKLAEPVAKAIDDHIARRRCFRVGQLVRHRIGSEWKLLEHVGGMGDDWHAECVTSHTDGPRLGEIRTFHREYMDRSFVVVGPDSISVLEEEGGGGEKLDEIASYLERSGTWKWMPPYLRELAAQRDSLLTKEAARTRTLNALRAGWEDGREGLDWDHVRDRHGPLLRDQEPSKAGGES